MASLSKNIFLTVKMIAHKNGKIVVCCFMLIMFDGFSYLMSLKRFKGISSKLPRVVSPRNGSLSAIGV